MYLKESRIFSSASSTFQILMSENALMLSLWRSSPVLYTWSKKKKHPTHIFFAVYPKISAFPENRFNKSLVTNMDSLEQISIDGVGGLQDEQVRVVEACVTRVRMTEEG